MTKIDPINIPEVISTLRSETAEFEWDDAWDTLKSIDGKENEHLPFLYELVKAPEVSGQEVYVKIYSLRAIYKIGGDFDLIKESLMQFVFSDNEELKSEAITAISRADLDENFITERLDAKSIEGWGTYDKIKTIIRVKGIKDGLAHLLKSA